MTDEKKPKQGDLEIPVEEPKPKKKKSESKAPVERGIYVTLKGTYYSKTISNCLPKPYELRLQLIDNPNYELPADDKRIQHLYFRRLLPDYFQSRPEEYPDYKGVRECRLINIEVIGGDTEEPKRPLLPEEKNPKKMSMSELVKFAAIKGLSTNPKDFSTIGDARMAVIDELEDMKIAEESIKAQQETEAVQKDKEFDDVKDILAFHDIR